MSVPTVPNSTLIRFLRAKGCDVEAARNQIAAACAGLAGGDIAGAELDGVRFIVANGVVLVAEPKLAVVVKGGGR